MNVDKVSGLGSSIGCCNATWVAGRGIDGEACCPADSVRSGKHSAIQFVFADCVARIYATQTIIRIIECLQSLFVRNLKA